MKRVILILSVLWVLCSASFTVYANTTLDVYSENITVKNNRLFDVKINVACNESLAAATFEISYDESMMEYRGVNTNMPDAYVKAVDKSGKIKAIFLKGVGIGKNENVNLFSVKFKSTQLGTANIKIKVYDCVDANAKNFNNTTEKSCVVNVQGGASGSNSDNTDKQKADEKDVDENDNNVKNFLSVNPEKVKGQEVYLFVIVFLVIFIVAIGALHISSMRKIQKKLTAEISSEVDEADDGRG